MIPHWLGAFCLCTLVYASNAEFNLKNEHLNKKLEKTELETFTSTSIQSCVRKCRKNPDCKSFNFDRNDDGQCLLYRYKSTDNGMTFSTRIGMIFSDIDIWPTAGDKCMNQTCDVGRCLSGGTTHVCKTFVECNKLVEQSVNVNDTATAVGTYLDITCSQDGTALIGNSVIQCMDDGYWSDSPFCE